MPYISNDMIFSNRNLADLDKDISGKYIFREKNEPYIYAVTDKFKEIVESNNLKMQFMEI